MSTNLEFMENVVKKLNKKGIDAEIIDYRYEMKTILINNSNFNEDIVKKCSEEQYNNHNKGRGLNYTHIGHRDLERVVKGASKQYITNLKNDDDHEKLNKKIVKSTAKAFIKYINKVNKGTITYDTIEMSKFVNSYIEKDMPKIFAEIYKDCIDKYNDSYENEDDERDIDI